MKHRFCSSSVLKPNTPLIYPWLVGSNTTTLIYGSWQGLHDPSPLTHEHSQFLSNWQIILPSMVASFLSLYFILLGAQG